MSPSSIERYLTVDEFNDELQTVVARIIHTVSTSVAAAKTPFKVSRLSMVHQAHKANLADKYMIVSNNEEIAIAQLKSFHAKALAGLGVLVKLPRETRDQVYRFLLASGFPDFLQASATLHQEGSDLIYQTGICRMNFAFAPLTPTMRPSQKLANIIQHISLRINTACYPLLGAPSELDILQLFTGSEITRKSCRVVFRNYLLSTPMVCDEVLFIMTRYTGFERVVVNIMIEDGEPLPVHLEFYQRDHILSTKDRGYRTITRQLAPYLGTPHRDWYKKDEMVFYPRRVLDADVKSELEQNSENGNEEHNADGNVGDDKGQGNR